MISEDMMSPRNIVFSDDVRSLRRKVLENGLRSGYRNIVIPMAFGYLKSLIMTRDLRNIVFPILFA